MVYFVRNTLAVQMCYMQSSFRRWIGISTLTLRLHVLNIGVAMERFRTVKFAVSFCCVILSLALELELRNNMYNNLFIYT